MLSEKKILSEVYPDWVENGIFKQLDSFDVPWKSYVDGSVLDLDYYGNRSGSKIVSTLIEKLLKDDELQPAQQAQIAMLVWKKYGYAWTKAWDALQAEYNPLENYKMTKTETEDRTLKMDGTKTSEKTVTDTGTIDKKNTGTTSTEDSKITESTKNTTDTGTLDKKNTGTVGTVEDETGNATSTNNSDSDTNNSIFGFNSNSASPSDTTTTNQNNTSETDNTVNRESTVTDNRNELTTRNLTSSDETDETVTTENTITDDRDELTTRNLTVEDSTTDVDDRTHKTDGVVTTEQEGNMGAMAYQQLLEKELQVRFDWRIFDLIYADIDNVLTINIFR